MNYADIKFPDIANGPGVRVSMFVSGCEFHCPECFNAEAWDFSAGKPFTESDFQKLIYYLGLPYCDGLTLLGGEPLHPRNVLGEADLVTAVRMAYPEKSIWCYTGYTMEELWVRMRDNPQGKSALSRLLKNIDVLVDGRFEIDKKDIKLRFAGSSNQRSIDMPKTLETGEIHLWQG